MKKILIPTDFSDTAHHAARYAMEFLGHREVHYVLFHVHNFSNLRNRTLAESEELLKKEMEQFRDSYHDAILTIETVTASGNVVEEILQMAAETKTELIVMGTRSRERPRWMGSNTESVLLEANCPVLAIPGPTNYRKIENVALTLAPGEVPQADRLEAILALLRPKGPDVHIVSVTRDPGSFPDEWMLTLKRMVGRALELHLHSLEGEDVVHRILEYCAENVPDLLVVFPEKRTLFKRLLHHSISKELAHLSTIPILSVTHLTTQRA